ncbi:M23 family metallopeptidase [Candidatus Magnetominusculus xianensis]|uniref:Peptidase M24 n=1 Tax=Candidatus Magnetominusculus xianensis TaxID=1748249 RepID=A0ABR5SFG0_9BACT|nr:M23 family metallopeptidase [Candidatus Magnetominusculus xianensis]KWT86054.1 peptidase M24 [Candidatus Magnetominusculus xianensis]MBF0404383.1 M23 family metallopeptidase [Nitrospirota bacterium]
MSVRHSNSALRGPLSKLLAKISCAFSKEKRPMIFFGFVFVLFLSMTYISLYFPKALYSSTSSSQITVVKPARQAEKAPQLKIINGLVKKGETLQDISKRYNLKADDVKGISIASRDLYNLKTIRPKMSYKIIVNPVNNDILELNYAIDDSSYLSVKRYADAPSLAAAEDYFQAEMVSLAYQMKIGTLTGTVKYNLVDSIGKSREHLNVAYELADLFAYDIDFNTDLRKGDTFEVVIEELYRDNIFKGYGKILYARFTNDGHRYEILRYDINGKDEYFRPDGNSIKKMLMRAPLRYRHISSFFSKSRFHPILRISRPHFGVDYSAPKGTPISAAGDGVVFDAGRNASYGNQLFIRHAGGYVTGYGHLSAFAKGLRNGDKVTQGEIIGYVGATGLATGPHLDYRVKLEGKPIDPLTMKLPASPIPAKHKEAFKTYVAQMRSELSKSQLAKASAKPAKKFK